MNILQKAAEILVERNYSFNITFYPENNRGHDLEERSNVNPFYQGSDKTLELWGRRQADAIEDWLRSQTDLDKAYWVLSAQVDSDKNITNFNQWRLDRIKWCLKELIK